MVAGVSLVGRSPFAFVSFGRCTPARGHGALPSFPSVTTPLQTGLGLMRVFSCVTVWWLVEPRCYPSLTDTKHGFRPTVLMRLAIGVDPL